MKFCRCIWGSDGRRLKVNNDIIFTLKTKFPIKFTSYTYGKENHKQLLDLGIDSKLIHDEDRKFVKESEFGHKLFAWKCMSEDNEKFVYLDWDVQLVKELPENIDEILKEKEFQLTLRMYSNPKARWRKEHQRKVPCASWIYFGNNKIANVLFDKWNEMGCPWREELVLAKYTEIDGKLDLDKFKELYETDLFKLKESIFKGSGLFRHFGKKEVGNIIKT